MGADHGLQTEKCCGRLRSGVNVWAQIDIALPPSTPLQLAHDIGESLEIKVEALECVERAFVHLDFEWLQSSRSIATSNSLFFLYEVCTRNVKD